MLAAYGVDVLDPGVSLRRVHVLLERLPPHARRIGEQWSTESELLASLIDQVGYLTWVTLRANGANPPRPEPMQRPALRGARAPASAPARARQDGGAVAAASWAEGIKQMTAIDGVRVRDG